MASVSRSTLALLVVLAILTGHLQAAPAAKTDKPSAAANALENGEQRAERSLCNTTDSEVDCNQTEYKEYMKCVEEKRAIRKKRQSSCPLVESSVAAANVSAVVTTIDDVSSPSLCEFSRQKCVVGCQGDAACIGGCITCDDSPTGVTCPGDYHDCVANCASGVACETTCKSLCPGAVRALGYKTVIFEGHNGDRSDQVQVPIGIAHNITTIIKLNNIINTTNHIHMPTSINNTNFNTVHLYSNATEGGEFGLGQTKDGSCCFAVQPKSCRASTAGLRCHHRRHKTCGAQCTARIIHVQKKTSCNRRSSSKCDAQVAYVPEPKPRCHYAQQWPYVSCGGGAARRNCNGCYDHYGQNSLYQMSVPHRCMACYDDGFDMGPRYRQGPFYRPSYYHQPPCYVTGSCYPMGGYGYYGPPPPVFAPPGDLPSSEDWYPGEDDEHSGDEPGEEFNKESWEEVVKKCKVINADENTVIVKNCTNAELVGNPYAARQADDEEEEIDKEQPERAAVAQWQERAAEWQQDMMMIPVAPQSPLYYQYPPYNYYGSFNYPPPAYYGPQPMPYNYMVPAPQKHRRVGSERMPSYYASSYANGQDDEAEESVDIWQNEDEKDLVDKGFEKVEEM